MVEGIHGEGDQFQPAFIGVNFQQQGAVFISDLIVGIGQTHLGRQGIFPAKRLKIAGIPFELRIRSPGLIVPIDLGLRPILVSLVLWEQISQRDSVAPFGKLFVQLENERIFEIMEKVKVDRSGFQIVDLGVKCGIALLGMDGIQNITEEFHRKTIGRFEQVRGRVIAPPLVGVLAESPGLVEVGGDLIILLVAQEGQRLDDHRIPVGVAEEELVVPGIEAVILRIEIDDAIDIGALRHNLVFDLAVVLWFASSRNLDTLIDAHGVEEQALVVYTAPPDETLIAEVDPPVFALFGGQKPGHGEGIGVVFIVAA